MKEQTQGKSIVEQFPQTQDHSVSKYRRQLDPHRLPGQRRRAAFRSWTTCHPIYELWAALNERTDSKTQVSNFHALHSSFLTHSLGLLLVTWGGLHRHLAKRAFPMARTSHEFKFFNIISDWRLLIIVKNSVTIDFLFYLNSSIGWLNFKLI